MALRDIFETVAFHFLSFSFRTRRKHPLDTIPKLSQASVQLRGKKNLGQKLKSDAYGTQRHLAFVIIPIRTQIHERVVKKKTAFIVRSQIQINGGQMRM